ncbi:MAG: AMP-binding protein [candidate division NC10 bacterium]|nr:AMP-binding protein [candidate division NC10 bacterium]
MLKDRDRRTTGYFDPEEVMPLEERRTYERAQLQTIVQHAYAHSKGTKIRLDEAQVRPQEIQGPDDLRRLPVLKKSELVDRQKQAFLFGDLLGVPMEELRRIYISPGPIYDPEGREAGYFGMGRALYAAGFRKGDLVQNCFAYHFTPGGMMMDNGLSLVGCIVIPAGTGNSELQARVLRDLPVTGYVGTPSFLMVIAEKAEELGFDVKKDLSLEVAFVGGEMLPETLRKALEEKFKVLVRQGYGTADLGAVAYECPFAAGMHLSEEVLVEIVDHETGEPKRPGEPGEVVVTVFNKVYPLIRFGTGDLSAFVEEPCPCGRTSKRLLGIFGRVGEATKVRGMFVHPRQVEEIVGRFPAIARWQVVVDRRGYQDEMTFRIELKEDVNQTPLLAELQKTIRDILKLRAEIEVVPAGTLREADRKIVDVRKWG